MDPKEYRLAAIMFTDIVGFSRMMESNEKATLQLLEHHNQIIKKHTEDLGGSIIKTIGDAFLIDFPNTVNAVNCAIRIQEDLEQRNRDNPDFTLVLRIGVHLGDIYFYENDALGEGINIASRLQSICNPGRICISQDVHNLVTNKIDAIAIKELGAVKLKNISREIRAYEILTNGSGEETSASSSPEIEMEMKHAAEKLEQERLRAASQETEVNWDELKQLVLGEIKRAGQRLRVDQVRGVIPGDSPEINEFLSEMVSKGFLSPAAPNAVPNDAAAQARDQVDPSTFPYNQRRHRNPLGQIGREIANEIGREVSREVREEIVHEYRDRHRQRSGHGGGSDYLPVPDRRGYGEDDREDKRIERAWDRVLDTPYDGWQDQQLIQEYRVQTMQSLKRMETSTHGHMASFVGVNALLVGIWFFTGASFPWFFFPLAGWGIGMANHVAALRRKRNEARQLQALPVLDKPQLKLLRRLNKLRSKFNSRVVSTVFTGIFLGGINLITSAMAPWSLIPITIMSIGLFSRFPKFKQQEHDLLGEMSKSGIPVAQLKNARRLKLAKKIDSSSSSLSPMEAEAQNLKAAVLAQVSALKDSSVLGEDFEQVLENYVTQVIELSRKEQEITATLNTIRITQLDREYADLQTQRKGTGNPDLIVELEKSMDSIEKQRKSYADLENQQRMLKVKIGSAINSLRQLQLDLVKMKRTPDIDDLPSADDLRNRTGEINHYLSDLENEYRRLEAMEKDLQ